ncbi:MAG: 2-C-methyl-D-erythritol 4-phosphate cytidylyltransferase [Betaproteobacteria bacterium]|nr:2-C-methyl-D-erythritol 4-phosphate cytidylyltransferase [Betaproteobacteria bacterium]
MSRPSATTHPMYALIPCAGTGARAGSDEPKQYRDVAGIPLVIHTLRAFNAISRIKQGLIVVAPDDQVMQDLVQKFSIPQFQVAGVGGAQRSDSVLAGLNTLLALGAKPEDWVLVHDAARCLITPLQINSLIDAVAEDSVGGLLAQPLTDTLKSAERNRVGSTVSRADKWLAQTPQMFRIGPLKRAIEQAGSAVTDESSAMEWMGLHPLLVACDSHNFKVTYAQDFSLAEAIFHMRHKQLHGKH